jgi:peptidoglycan/LPS O-acetylase OafA/YrhL
MTIDRNNPRIRELDGLRGIAIMSVMIHHAFGTPLLWAGVDIFFVLSGFLITGILLRRTELGASYFADFYARRARRILIPYVLLLAIVSIVSGASWMKHWYWFALFATNIGAAVHDIRNTTLIPLWSLAVEEQFYLLWPVIVACVSRNALLRIGIGLILAAPFLRAVSTPFFDSHFPIYYLTPFRMDLLASGAVLACLKLRPNSLLTRLGVWPSIILFSSVGALILLGRIDPGFHTVSNTVRSNSFIYFLTEVMATSLVIIALNGRGLICWILRNAALRYIGEISYSMYLIHQVALSVAGRTVHGRIAGFVLAMLLTVAYGTICWFGFERRLLARPRNREGHFPPAATGPAPVALVDIAVLRRKGAVAMLD